MKRIILILFSMLLFASCHVEEIGINQGYGELDDFSETVLYSLDGQWEFLQEGNWGLGQIPSLWSGKIHSGSYRLKLSLPSDEKYYSLYVRDCFTQYRLTVDGAVLHSGDRPSIKPRIFNFHASGMTEIRFDIEDRETTFGGIHTSLYFGNPDQVSQLFNRRNMGDLLIAGALLFSAVLYFSVGVIDRRGSSGGFLWLALANFFMALRYLTTYNRIILLFADNFYLWERVSTVTTPLIAISIAMYFLKIYRYPGYGFVMRLFIGVSLFYSIIVIGAPIIVFYRISPIYLAFLIFAIYATVHISIIHFKRIELKRSAIVWIFALTALIYLLIRAFLIWKGIVTEQNHQLYGFLMLLQGVQNAIRYGETFRHNISLIEQKDNLFSRVSHSFKTPLYAVKGAIDLVKNSDDACGEFEKQYKVMDRALTDLMIQINDMLNLTEFEFSHQMVQTRVPVTQSVQTVLIVDDQAIISSILGQQLKQFVKRMDLLVARSAEEALFLLKTNNIDFIFSDIMMAGTNGYEFVSRCRSLGYLVPIYLFSAGSDVKSREKALDVGANGYLDKPATIEQLKKVTSLHLLHIGD